MLERASCDCDFADRAACGVQLHIRGGWAFGAMIALDVAGADLEVSHISTTRDDTASAIVTDVTADDVDLVKVQLIKENTNAAILVEVAVRDEHVAIPGGEMNRMAALPHDDATERDLHRADRFDAISLGMFTDDLHATDHRRAFLFPHRWLETARCRSALVAAFKKEGWPRTRHDDSRRAIAGKCGESALGQRNFDAACNPVSSTGKAHTTVLMDSLFDGSGVIRGAIAFRPEISHIRLSLAQ